MTATHATNFEKLKLGNMKRCSGRSTHQGATQKLDSQTSRVDEVLGKCVYARCPHHRSTTTNTAQPQRVGALLPMPSCLGIGGHPGPGKDTHGTLGPEQRRGRGWPTPTPTGRSAHAMKRTQDSPTHKFLDQQNQRQEVYRAYLYHTRLFHFMDVQETIPIFSQHRRV